MKQNIISHFKALVVLGCVLASANRAAAGGFYPSTNELCTNNLPCVSILATDGTCLEGTSTGAFTLFRDGDTNADLAVDIEICGTASNGVDYAAITNPIIIPAGFLAVDIPVTPIIDTAVRGNKCVILKILENSAYCIHKHRHAKVEIIDDTFNIPPPTIELTSPTNDCEFMYPATITLTAAASDDSDAQIQSVSFYANDDFLGCVTNAPYTLTWTNACPGHYALFARAVDDLNHSAISCPVDICVTNSAPVVCITSPGNCEVTSGENIWIEAAASCSYGHINCVAFYANNHLIGKATHFPYKVKWSKVPKGNYAVEAIVTTQNGTQGCSHTVTIQSVASSKGKGKEKK